MFGGAKKDYEYITSTDIFNVPNKISLFFICVVIPSIVTIIMCLVILDTTSNKRKWPAILSLTIIFALLFTYVLCIKIYKDNFSKFKK